MLTCQAPVALNASQTNRCNRGPKSQTQNGNTGVGFTDHAGGCVVHVTGGTGAVVGALLVGAASVWETELVCGL